MRTTPIGYKKLVGFAAIKFADIEKKRKIISSMFPEKMPFTDLQLELNASKKM